MISGYATTEGTDKFVKNSGVNPDNFKIFENLYHFKCWNWNLSWRSRW